MKGVQCYELFGGIALKIHTFSFFISFHFVSYFCQYLAIMSLRDNSLVFVLFLLCVYLRVCVCFTG